MSVVLSRTTSNNHVRALVEALENTDCLSRYYTTLEFPKGLHSFTRFFPELTRRNCPLPTHKLRLYPKYEILRLLTNRFSSQRWTKPIKSIGSLESINDSIDKFTAINLMSERKSGAKIMYAYEDVAYHSFCKAKELNMHTAYELNIAYYETLHRILNAECDRHPEWAETIATKDESPEKLERKRLEVDLADRIICCSQFVFDSLPDNIRQKAIISPFGAPKPLENPKIYNNYAGDQVLRVLFAGSMTQRKGLADLFAAMKLLNRKDVELTVMGTLHQPLEWYKAQYKHFRYEQPRPNQQVLDLMSRHDLFVFPSLCEGRALVVGEAMSRGLPIIITPNTGNQDLVEEGKTGYLVPIRSPEKLADRISWFADNRDRIPQMADYARGKIAEYSWERYTNQILMSLPLEW